MLLAGIYSSSTTRVWHNVKIFKWRQIESLKESFEGSVILFLRYISIDFKISLFTETNWLKMAECCTHPAWEGLWTRSTATKKAEKNKVLSDKSLTVANHISHWVKNLLVLSMDKYVNWGKEAVSGHKYSETCEVRFTAKIIASFSFSDLFFLHLLSAWHSIKKIPASPTHLCATEIETNNLAILKLGTTGFMRRKVLWFCLASSINILLHVTITTLIMNYFQKIADDNGLLCDLALQL